MLKLEKENTKIKEEVMLPVLNTEPTYLDTSLNQKISTVSTKNMLKNNRLSLKKLFTMKEEERIYKLSEINKVKDERASPDSSLVEMRRVWDAYPSYLSKGNVLQSIRKQFSTYATEPSYQLPSIHKSASEDGMILEANKLHKERTKHSNISTSSLKIRSKRDLLDDNNNIAHKNFLIKILREERINLNDREKQITESLADLERKLTMDEQEFNICKEGDMKEHKQQELKIIEILTDIKNSNIRLKELIEIDKKLCNELHQHIKRIFSLQKYASFIHEVIGIKTCRNFNKKFIEISDTANKKNEILQVTEDMIDAFDLNPIHDEEVNLNLFQDTDQLKTRFQVLEDDIIKLLDKISLIEKDHVTTKIIQQTEMIDLKQKEVELRSERKNLKTIEVKDDKIIKSLNKKSNNEVDNSKILQFINSIKVKAESDFFDLKLLSDKKKNEDQTNVVKNTIDILKLMEAKVNKDIESLNEMSKENPALLKKMINLRREEIKLKKQDLIKKKTIEVNLEKKRKTEERMNKIIIKGRVVHNWRLLVKEKKVVKKSNEETQEEEEKAILYGPKKEDI